MNLPAYYILIWRRYNHRKSSTGLLRKTLFNQANLYYKLGEKLSEMKITRI